VLEQLVPPADGPAGWPRPSASWRSGARAGRGGLGRAVAGDGRGIAFNAQAVTVAAQIVAAEASGRAAGGQPVVGPSNGTGQRRAGLLEPVSGTGGGRSVASRTPALRVRRTAGGPGELGRAVGLGRKPRHEAAAAVGDGKDAGPLGVGGGRTRTGRRGLMASG